MDKNEIFQKLQQIFREVLENDNLTIYENTKTSTIKGWDSLSHINIIRQIEKTFDIHFSIGEIVVLKTISDLIKLIQQKIS